MRLNNLQVFSTGYITGYDARTDKDLHMVFYKEEDIKDIKSKSGPLAISNEYQCSYSALVETLKVGDENIRFVYPLVYFNYPQEVSGAAIDFEGKDVREAAKGIEEMTEVLAKNLIKKLKSCKTPYETSYQVTYANNIHRHP